MRSERLRHRITIQVQSTTRDSYNQPVDTWTTFATVWANIVQKSSREFYSAQKINAEITELFVIRYLPGLLSNMRVIFDNRYFDIIGPPIIPREIKTQMQIICKELI